MLFGGFVTLCLLYFIRVNARANTLVSSIVIGHCNRLDIVDAKRRTKIPIKFLSPDEFYEEYKEGLKGEPRWLFID